MSVSSVFQSCMTRRLQTKRGFFYPDWPASPSGPFYPLVDLAQARLHSLGRFRTRRPLSILASATAGIRRRDDLPPFFNPLSPLAAPEEAGKKQGPLGRSVFSRPLSLPSGIFLPFLVPLRGGWYTPVPIPYSKLAVILAQRVAFPFAFGYFRKYGFLAAVSLPFFGRISSGM